MNIKDLEIPWQNVKKNLPEVDGYYWTYGPESPCITCKYQTLRYQNGIWISRWKITHWMDLPPKPLVDNLWLWNSVETILPEIYAPYWTYSEEAPHPTCQQQMVRYVNRDWITCFRVTHWMDLPPEPLKDE